MIKVGGHKIGEVRQGNDLYTAIYLGAKKIYSVATIDFADQAVKALCVSNWGGNVVEGEITKGEAAAVTSLNGVFREKTQITTFDELRFFTGLTSLSISGIDATAIGEFDACTNLERITLPKASITNLAGAFHQCLKIRFLDLTPLSAGINISALTRYTSGSGLPTYDTEYLTEVKLPSGAYAGDWYQVFNRRKALQKIVIDGVADLSGLNGTTNDFSNAFNQCTSLTTISGGIVGISQSISFQHCPLTADSAMVIINGLADLTGQTGKTLTLSSTTKTALTAAGIDYDTIATAKNWQIS